MSNLNPQLKEYIREQLTNRLFESVENISEAQYRPRVPRNPAPVVHAAPRPATSRSAPHGLNVTLAAAIGLAQGAQSAADEWNENKAKGMSDEENTEKTTTRALTAGGIEATLAFALARAGQKMAMTIPITGKHKWAKGLRGPAGTLAGASLALGIGNTVDDRANQWTNRNEDPRLRQIELEKRQMQEFEALAAQEDRKREIRKTNPYVY